PLPGIGDALKGKSHGRIGDQRLRIRDPFVDILRGPNPTLLAKFLHARGIHRGIVGNARSLASDNVVELRSHQRLGTRPDLMADRAFGERRFAFGRIAGSERGTAQRDKRDSTEPTNPKYPHLKPSMKMPAKFSPTLAGPTFSLRSSVSPDLAETSICHEKRRLRHCNPKIDRRSSRAVGQGAWPRAYCLLTLPMRKTRRNPSLTCGSRRCRSFQCRDLIQRLCRGGRRSCGSSRSSSPTWS